MQITTRSLFASRRRPPWIVFLILGTLWIGRSGAGTDSTQPATRQSAPDPAAMREASKLVKDVYKDDLAGAKDAVARSALASKLLQTAIDEQKDMAGRYVLFTLARDVAVEAGDFDTAGKSIDEMAQRYAVDGLRLKADAAASAAKLARRPEDRQTLISQIDPLIDAALAADRYDVARQVSDLSQTLSRASNDSALAKQSAARAAQIRQMETAFADVKKSMTAFETKPSDPDANLKVGKFRCFIKGDWEHGLGNLARGADPVLRQLATRDMADPSSGPEQLKLADGWWDQGQKSAGESRRQTIARAVKWYAAARENLSGLQKLAAEKKLKEAEAAAGPAAPPPAKDVLATMQGASRTANGLTILDRGGRIRTADRFQPPVQFDIVAMTDSTNIRLGYAADQIIFNWEMNLDELRIDGGPAAGRHLKGAGRVPINTPVTISLIVLPDSMSIWVEGKLRYQTKADFSKVDQPLTIFTSGRATVGVKSVRVRKP